MSDGREALFDELFEIAAKYNVALTNSPAMNPGVPEIGDFCGDVEAAVLAAGYRRPRTVTTVIDLAVLGARAAVLDANGCVWVNDGDQARPWASVVEDPQGDPVWSDDSDIALPATVLHEPEAGK